MSKATFSPILSVLALAGSPDAAKHAAFADLTRCAVMFLQSGTKNGLQDTRDALATLKGSQAKRCAALVETVFADCNATFDAMKRQHVIAATAQAKTIIARAIAAFDADEETAKAAKAAKAADSKAKAENAAKAAAAALKAAAKSVEPLARALTLADALAMIAAACAAGDEQALSGVQAIAETYFDTVVAA